MNLRGSRRGLDGDDGIAAAIAGRGAPEDDSRQDEFRRLDHWPDHWPDQLRDDDGAEIEWDDENLPARPHLEPPWQSLLERTATLAAAGESTDDDLGGSDFAAGPILRRTLARWR